MNSSLAEIADRCYPVKSTISASDEFIVQGCKVREVVFVQIDGNQMRLVAILKVFSQITSFMEIYETRRRMNKKFLI